MPLHDSGRASLTASRGLCRLGGASPCGGAKLRLHHSCIPSELVAQIPRASPLLFPPCEGGVGGGGPVSLECTMEPCWARPIDDADGACGALPSFEACRFRTS